MKGSGSSSWSARPRLTVLPRPAPPGVDILHVQGWILDFYPCPAPAARHYFPIICSHPTWSPTNPNTFSFLCPPQHWKAHTCSFEGVENSFLSHPWCPAVRPYPHIPSQPWLFVYTSEQTHGAWILLDHSFPFTFNPEISKIFHYSNRVLPHKPQHIALVEALECVASFREGKLNITYILHLTLCKTHGWSGHVTLPQP